ncbi:MAG: bifunctional phosphoribosyl-AMP cyclohydrolase/phosphoribosyl-ATP diphosphatase HisIE [Gemmatimonadota bacterium]
MNADPRGAARLAGGSRLGAPADLDALNFAKGGGLVPLIAQDADSGEVLMLGYANREALERTLAEGRVWFHSRSRDRLWMKGETSGNELRLVAAHADCDGDAVLALVRPAGAACHTGARSCFGGTPVLLGLADTLRARARDLPEGSYTTRLLADANLRLKKLGEEAAELVAALALGDAESVRSEAADLLYHVLVAGLAGGVQPEELLAELRARR